MKNNYVIKAFRISTILKDKVERAKHLLSKNDYLDIKQQDFNRLALNHFCDLVFSGNLNLKILKIKAGKQ